MKKFLILSILTFISISLFSQKISSLPPTLIVWQNGNQKVSLKAAHYGVKMNDSLTLQVYFHQYNIDRLTNSKNLTLEFRWYYYLSTRLSLMKIEKVNIKDAKKLKDNIVMFQSSKKVLTPGWWEVQIVNTNDKGLLQIGGVSKFQILIK